MPASLQEIERVRFHLGFGNLGLGSQPYTKDGFYSLFQSIIRPNLNEAEETIGNTAITAGVVAITPDAMAGITTHTRLVVDVGADTETVVVRATTQTTFTARFDKAHSQPYPICVESGLTELRRLLVALEREYKSITSGDVSQASGLKQVGKGAVEWFGPNSKLNATVQVYEDLVLKLYSLLNIEPPMKCDPSRLEVY